MAIHKIYLGSKSEDKKSYLESALNLFGYTAEIISQDVDALISDQPLSEEETILGSIERAQKAWKTNAFLSVGLEGGLSKINGRYYLVCASTMITQSQISFSGLSAKRPLPQSVSDGIQRGESFGDLIRIFRKNLISDTPYDVVKMIDELISRRESFGEAIGSSLFLIKYFPSY